MNIHYNALTLIQNIEVYAKEKPPTMGGGGGGGGGWKELPVVPPPPPPHLFSHQLGLRFWAGRIKRREVA